MIKLSTKTIIKNIVYKTIDIWKSKLPEQSLDSYDNWKEDIVEGICDKLAKHGINVDEVLIVEDPDNENPVSEAQ
jgi:hypothetical protein